MVRAETDVVAQRTLRTIDCDVHPTVRGGLRSLFPYMPEAWVRRFELKNVELSISSLSMKYAHPNGGTSRVDARPPSGGPPGSDPDFIVTDLLERHGIDRALLNPIQAAAAAVAFAGPDESVVLVRAFNDYFAEWTAQERRFMLSVTVPSQDPAAAAAEIRRMAGRLGVVAVSLPLLDLRMGNRHYYPIYEAAQEAELPILVHPTGTESIYHGGPPLAAGIPATYIERYVDLVQIAQANLSSLIFDGVFERFSGLKVVFVEWGFSWLPPLLWRMDRSWYSLRIEVPWVKRWPSEYVEQQVRFTTQPIDEPRREGDLEALIGLMSDEVLLFSTDYPHWDNDMPGSVLQTLPEATRRKIFADNARALFKLDERDFARH